MTKHNPNHISCPACGSNNLLPIFSKSGMPRYDGERHRTQKGSVEASRGDLDFRFCSDCLFAFNAAFDQSHMDYQVDYNASRASSQHFNHYLAGVAREVADIFNTPGKTVVEVGCGDGDFLNTLTEEGDCVGIGYDPSITDRNIPPKHSLSFKQSYYTKDSMSIPPDILILRHMLEHQGEPKRFFDSILDDFHKETECNIYIEVPAWEWIVDNSFCFVFSYEHCSYYSRFSMSKILASYGYPPLKISYSFDDEYLQYFGSNRHIDTPPDNGSRESIVRQTEQFVRKLPGLLEMLRNSFNSKDAILWGGGGKGITLLNMLDISHNELAHVVDSNPAKWGTYIPGTGQHVISPATLEKLRPKRVYATNKNYVGEISADLAKFGLHPEIISIDTLLRENA